jgi:hypothetical protein
MSTVAITFAAELRARADEDLELLFQYRPDLVSPVQALVHRYALQPTAGVAYPCTSCRQVPCVRQPRTVGKAY